MRRVAHLVTLACLLPAALVLAAPAGSAQPEDCGPGRACLYTRDNFKGDRIDYGRDRFNDTCITTMYRSIKNRTADENVFVYPDEHCDGRSGMTLVQPGNDLITGDHRSLRFSRDLWPDQGP
jgi:hypothetical protein